MGVILTADNITMAYGNKPVLKDINIKLNEGELVSILGVSGVGKTTLFNVLSGLARPDSGKVLLYGETEQFEAEQLETEQHEGDKPLLYNREENDEGDDALPCTDITGKTGYLSYMMQKDLLLPHMTVIENVALPLVLEKMPKKKALQVAGKHFEQFGIDGTQDQYPSKLSGGMRQRAALLRTYLCGKRVALLDEPFSALDTITRTSMQQWYLNMRDELKLSTLFITHDVDEAILLSDRIYIMKGSPAAIEDELEISKDNKKDPEFTLTGEFLEYKRMIKKQLK